MKVKLFLHFPQYFSSELGKRTGTVEVEEGITVREFLKRMEVGEGLKVSINGRLVKNDQPLKENDILSVFPLSVGG